MKTVVITGSARGLGFEMAKQFRMNNFNVVISDVLEEKLKEAKINWLTNAKASFRFMTSGFNKRDFFLKS